MLDSGGVRSEGGNGGRHSLLHEEKNCELFCGAAKS
jgi:hypothetical protein